MASNTDSIRTIFVESGSRPIRLWTECVSNGVTLTVTATLKHRSASWTHDWVFEHRRKIGLFDTWIRSILGRPVPIRSSDTRITDRRIELRAHWPWNYRMIFVRPPETLLNAIGQLFGRNVNVSHIQDVERTVDASVLGVLNRTSIRLIICPGVGLADGGANMDVPLTLVPPQLRLPNTRLTVTMQGGKVVQVDPLGVDEENQG